MNNPATLGVAEAKGIAQTFLMHNFSERLGHLYDDNDVFVMGKGFCKLHGKHCGIDKRRPCVSSGGYPCQPFTGCRPFGGATPKTGPAPGHPDFETLMKGFEQYLSARSPMCFWIEEVVEIGTTMWGKATCLQIIMSAAARQGYSVRALNMNHADWAGVPRLRMHVLRCWSLRIQLLWASSWKQNVFAQGAPSKCFSGLWAHHAHQFAAL